MAHSTALQPHHNASQTTRTDEQSACFPISTERASNPLCACVALIDACTPCRAWLSCPTCSCPSSGTTPSRLSRSGSQCLWLTQFSLLFFVSLSRLFITHELIPLGLRLHGAEVRRRFPPTCVAARHHWLCHRIRHHAQEGLPRYLVFVFPLSAVGVLAALRHTLNNSFD